MSATECLDAAEPATIPEGESAGPVADHAAHLETCAGCRHPSRRIGAPVLLVLFGLSLVLLNLAAGPPAQAPEVKLAAAAPEHRANYPEDFHPPLQGESGEVPGLSIYGPDAAECVKFAAEGLRISLPGTYPVERPGTGCVTDFGVRGDFEITLSFEFVTEPRLGVWGNPTVLQLVVVPEEPVKAGLWHRTDQNRASLARVAPGRKASGQFRAQSTRWNNENLPTDEWGNENFNTIESLVSKQSPAQSATGRLRLVRGGPTLYFYVGEGADKDFSLLYQSEFGTKDLKNVRILARTGGPGASFNVRVTDLHIRADAFPKVGQATLQPDQPAWARRWLVVVLALSFGITVPVGVLLYLRARRQVPQPSPTASPAPASAIGVNCPGCGKRLKVRRDLAGKKLKCPHCSGAVVVPEAPPVKPEESA